MALTREHILELDKIRWRLATIYRELDKGNMSEREWFTDVQRGFVHIAYEALAKMLGVIDAKRYALERKGQRGRFHKLPGD